MYIRICRCWLLVDVYRLEDSCTSNMRKTYNIQRFISVYLSEYVQEYICVDSFYSSECIT